MKWGKKKTLSCASSSSSSSSPSLTHCSQPSSLISHVFPVSWISKFKHKNTAKPEPKPRKLTEKLNSSVPKCPSLFGGNNGSGKFYYAFEDDDDDAFWRLSFRRDNAGEKKGKKVGLKPSVRFEEPFSSCPNCSAVPKCKREKETVLRLSAKSARELKRSTKNLGGLGKVEEDKMSFDLQSLREMNAKSEEQRKSFYVRMERPKKRNGNNRVKAYSPRTALRAETCKVKALEDMKKANLKKKKKKKKRERTGLVSFAVVKSSFDPAKDFKDSMVEMILEKKMRQPDELQELLACYLTLNSDEFHGLIIKVFREVWLELGELNRMKQVFSD